MEGGCYKTPVSSQREMARKGRGMEANSYHHTNLGTHLNVGLDGKGEKRLRMRKEEKEVLLMAEERKIFNQRL